MIKITLNDNSSYSEVGQPNSLRWKNMYKNIDGSFIDQSGWWKCKDFLNDTVAFFKAGLKFSIYGYKNDIKKNPEGVYFLLKNIADKKKFFTNLDVVNKQLYKDLNCQVAVTEMETPDQAIVMIPTECWESTYRISMITMAVRLCNYDITYKEWGDLWKKSSPAITIDGAFTPKAVKNAQQLGFLVPEKYNKYWWFAGDQYNSETLPKQTGSLIHNNGVCGWTEGMSK